jgi:hypothetical protein
VATSEAQASAADQERLAGLEARISAEGGAAEGARSEAVDLRRQLAAATGETQALSAALLAAQNEKVRTTVFSCPPPYAE